MPYKNIWFIKLKKSLLNDPRWYMMSEKSQLNYIKLLMFAAESDNKICRNFDALRRAFKTDQDLTTIENTLNEIIQSFPKFKCNKHFYFFENFHEYTNYVQNREIPGKSQGTPRDCPEEEEDKEEDKEKEEEKMLDLWNSLCLTNSVFSSLQTLTRKRREKVRSRLKEKAFNFPEILAALKEQSFCAGANDRKWKVTFDWLIANDENYIKVLERRYKNAGDGKSKRML